MPPSAHMGISRGSQSGSMITRTPKNSCSWKPHTRASQTLTWEGCTGRGGLSNASEASYLHVRVILTATRQTCHGSLVNMPAFIPSSLYFLDCSVYVLIPIPVAKAAATVHGLHRMRLITILLSLQNAVKVGCLILGLSCR